MEGAQGSWNTGGITLRWQHPGLLKTALAFARCPSFINSTFFHSHSVSIWRINDTSPKEGRIMTTLWTWRILEGTLVALGSTAHYGLPALKEEVQELLFSKSHFRSSQGYCSIWDASVSTLPCTKADQGSLTFSAAPWHFLTAIFLAQMQEMNILATARCHIVHWRFYQNICKGALISNSCGY